MSKNNICIVGLGWLGLPLYKRLVGLNYLCKGSTTSIEKEKNFKSKGISAYQVKIKETEIEGDIEGCLKDSKIIILNIPPGLRRNPDSSYIAKIEQLLVYIKNSSVEKVLYISSTSVFEDEEHFPIIINSTLPNATSKAGLQLRKVEELLKNSMEFETTILRFSGLVDQRRHPATMMSKRASVGNPNAPVNLIHREDCIKIITEIVAQKKWGITLNASYPIAKTKKDYYNKTCKQLNLSNPNFDHKTVRKGKKIKGNETKEELGFAYKHPV